MPGRYLIANWKMNLPKGGIDAHMWQLRERKLRDDDPLIVIAPPFPFLERVAALAMTTRIDVAAQDASSEKSGARTGEVAAWMVLESGARYVIVGHSERRMLHSESNEEIGRKMAAVIDAALTPVFCFGEDLAAREQGRTVEVLAEQLRGARSDALETAATVVLAYEPVWAIGTGRNASGAMVGETRREIGRLLEQLWPARHANAPLLYGGSVTPENVEELATEGDIDGFLVGGASLDAEAFLAIAEGMRRE